MVKNLPAKQEMWVRSLGWEDLLEKAVAMHSSFLAWKIPQTEEPGVLQFMGLQRARHDLATEYKHNLFFELFFFLPVAYRGPCAQHMVLGFPVKNYCA